MSFHCFPRLLPEMRLKIWEYALIEESTTRLVIIEPEYTDDCIIFPTKDLVSPLLSTNYESRQAAKAYYDCKLPVYRIVDADLTSSDRVTFDQGTSPHIWSAVVFLRMEEHMFTTTTSWNSIKTLAQMWQEDTSRQITFLLTHMAYVPLDRASRIRNMLFEDESDYSWIRWNPSSFSTLQYIVQIHPLGVGDAETWEYPRDLVSPITMGPTKMMESYINSGRRLSRQNFQIFEDTTDGEGQNSQSRVPNCNDINPQYLL